MGGSHAHPDDVRSAWLDQTCQPVSLIDIYPTLIELCGLEPKEQLEGVSLLPLLKNPNAPWNRPALTTYGRNNHSVRSQRWRYIRYFDGTEELYDHDNDPLEWHNMANNPANEKIKTELSRWLPKTNTSLPAKAKTKLKQ